jgi:hypothetical protein
MKKISFFALMSMFALATPSCDKDATDFVDKTEYSVVILVEGRNSNSSSDAIPLDGATVKFLDLDKTLTTDAKGKATLTLTTGTYRISVEKSSYEYSSSTYSFGSDEFVRVNVSSNTFTTITLVKK